jgi:hypothetical protein
LVVVIGHLSFAALTAAQDSFVAVAARLSWEISVGCCCHRRNSGNGVGDKLGFLWRFQTPAHSAEEKQIAEEISPRDLGTTSWALFMIAGSAIVIIRYVDLHAVSASASAGFLVVFAMVNAGNVRLARRRTAPMDYAVAAAACIAALVVMVCADTRAAAPPALDLTIAAVMTLPFLYEIGYSRL